MADHDLSLKEREGEKKKERTEVERNEKLKAVAMDIKRHKGPEMDIHE